VISFVSPQKAFQFQNFSHFYFSLGDDSFFFSSLF
jgi:hypothetical protein